MPDKCGACDGCRASQEIKATRDAAKNKRDKAKASKKLKRVERRHPCTGAVEGRDNQEPAPKKIRRGEANLLGASSFGGRYRGDSPPLHDVPLAREDRAARPLADLNEDNFNAAAFDGYCDVVLQCTKAASTTSSPDVKAEAEGVITKMRGLLHQGVKHEVDFVEATKDTSYILARWMNGQPAGKKAFIPDADDRDECYYV